MDVCVGFPGCVRGVGKCRRSRIFRLVCGSSGAFLFGAPSGLFPDGFVEAGPGGTTGRHGTVLHESVRVARMGRTAAAAIFRRS